MSFQQPVKSPNIDKLFIYLQKSQWHNVSANFSGFVRKEFENNLDKLEDDDETYRNMKLMVEYSEMGRFTEAKTIIEPAYKEYNEMLSRLVNLQLGKSPGNRSNQHGHGSNTHRQGTYTPDNRPGTQTGHGSNTQRQGAYTPDNRRGNQTGQRSNTNRHEVYSTDNRPPGSPNKRNVSSPQPGFMPQPTVDDRSPRNDEEYRQYQEPTQAYDQHRDNYDALRLKSPDKTTPYNQQRNESPRIQTSDDQRGHDNRQSGRHGRQSPGILTSTSQMVSSNALWGREHGDKPNEKIGNSTYRQEFPVYPLEHHERIDKEKYRENFGSLAERGTYRGGDDMPASDLEPRRSGHGRHTETPDYDQRPSELGRKFKELYNNEWTDAYDEICKDFGSEKTARHLLWIVTEATLIANDVADRQLRELEKQAFGVMTTPTPGSNDVKHLDKTEGWLIAVDVAEKQLKDLERATLGLMTIPVPTNNVILTAIKHGGYVPRNLGDTLPTSRNLLLKYRKQTAVLSVPYVKEECRDKITRTLLESSGFARSYLGDASRVTAYIYKCAELVWMMCVQDPPIVLEYITKDTEGARFNHDHYNVYTKSGTTYDYGVWPMLRLGRRGQVLAKGIAQGI